MGRFKLGIIVPAFNEENTISNVVQGLLNYGIPIVVNDGSNDKTKDLAECSGALVVNHLHRKGYEQAIRTGFKKAKQKQITHIITFDADGQHFAGTIEHFINCFHEGCHVIGGIRSNKPRIAEHLFAFATKKLFGIEDPLCGMKGYDMKVYDAKKNFSTFNSIGTELIIFAIKKGYKLNQVDVPINERKDKPRFYGVIKSNLIIIKALIITLVKNTRGNGFEK